MLNKKELQQLISLTQQHINLAEFAIEKDYYITQIIHALSSTEDDYFRLIFSGGTCLAKAHKIVKRMSEDVDFKIQIKKIDEKFSKATMLSKLKEFRSLVTSKLEISNLIIRSPVVRNEGRYSRIEVDYPAVFSTNKILRPHVLLEFTMSDIRLAVESLNVKTLIEETLENIDIFEKRATQCTSVNETGIEKWVGLTRRIIAIERGYHHDDKTLIRHLYDLNEIKRVNKIDDNFSVLAKSIINYDAKQFKNQHPEYSEDAGAEIKESLSLLRNKSLWKERYEEFIETMVYDATSVPKYGDALDVLDQLSEKVLSSLYLETA